MGLESAQTAWNAIILHEMCVLATYKPTDPLEENFAGSIFLVLGKQLSCLSIHNSGGCPRFELPFAHFAI